MTNRKAMNVNIYYKKSFLSLAFTDASKFFNATLIDLDGTHEWIVAWAILNTEWMFSLDLGAFIHGVNEVGEAIHEVFFR